MKKRKNYLIFFLVFFLGVLSGILLSEYLISYLDKFLLKKEKKIMVFSQGPKSKYFQTEIFCEKIKKGKGIEVNLRKQKVKLCENGKAIEEFLVSTGKKESPTPTGTFFVIKKSPMIYSKIANCWLPFWVGFYNDYGFHELPISKDGKRIGEKEIGKPASLGCIRLKVDSAQKLYQFAEIGMKVVIFGEIP